MADSPVSQRRSPTQRQRTAEGAIKWHRSLPDLLHATDNGIIIRISRCRDARQEVPSVQQGHFVVTHHMRPFCTECKGSEGHCLQAAFKPKLPCFCCTYATEEEALEEPHLPSPLEYEPTEASGEGAVSAEEAFVAAEVLGINAAALLQTPSDQWLSGVGAGSVPLRVTQTRRPGETPRCFKTAGKPPGC